MELIFEERQKESDVSDMENNFHVNPCRRSVSVCKDDTRKSEVMRVTARGGSASDCQNPLMVAEL